MAKNIFGICPVHLKDYEIEISSKCITCIGDCTVERQDPMTGEMDYLLCTDCGGSGLSDYPVCQECDDENLGDL